jgi:protein MpaA
LKHYLFGKTQNGLPVFAYEFNPEADAKHILILGGVHGDEVEGVGVANALVSRWMENNPLKSKITVVPFFNMDGTLAGQRKNANGVDLNRNLPSKDWTSDVANERYFPGTEAGSEPENKSLMRFLENNKLDFIISLHSFSRYLLNVNGDCEPIASVLNELTGYPIEESMGYPTPGCLGTLTGFEMGIPTITYELNRGQDLAELIPVHTDAIEKAILKFEN